MIQITPHMRVLVAIEPADFRCGIDGLAQLCRQRLGDDPLGGTMFVFRNKRVNPIRWSFIIQSKQGEVRRKTRTDQQNL